MPDIRCVVEIPKRSRSMYEWSPEHRRFLLDRFFSSSVVFPTDYGFVPKADSGDGDPLDVLDVLDGLPEHLREEITHPFIAFEAREGHAVSEDGWEGREAAERVVAQARERAGADS